MWVCSGSFANASLHVKRRALSKAPRRGAALLGCSAC